jgi:hypothetical protein
MMMLFSEHSLGLGSFFFVLFMFFYILITQSIFEKQQNNSFPGIAGFAWERMPGCSESRHSFIIV